MRVPFKSIDPKELALNCLTQENDCWLYEVSQIRHWEKVLESSKGKDPFWRETALELIAMSHNGIKRHFTVYDFVWVKDVGAVQNAWLEIHKQPFWPDDYCKEENEN